MISELLAFLSLILMSFVSFYSIRRLNSFEKKIPSLDDYVQIDEETGEIQIERRLNALLTGAGASMMKSAKMGFLGQLSGQARLEKGLKGAMAKDIVDNKMPLLSLVGDFLGYNVKQYIGKNPDALMQLVSMPQIQGLLANMSGNNPRKHDGRVW